MKKFYLLAILLLVSISLAACKEEDPFVNYGESIDFAERYQKKSTIRVWMDDDSGAYKDELIAAFNEIHPNIYVEFKHSGSVDTREQLKIFGPSGQGADVIQFPHDHLAQAFLEDLIYQLPAETRALIETRSNILGIEVSTMEVDGVKGLYAVPISAESIGLYYNKAHITEPHTNFEDLIADAEIWNSTLVTVGEVEMTNMEAGRPYLTTSSHFGDSYFMQPFYSAFGFRPFGEDGNDPLAVGYANAAPALQWMRDELKPITTGVNGKYNDGKGANFEAGHVPYIIAGPWNNEAYLDADIDFGVAKFPTISVDGVDEETATFAGAQVAAVYKYSKNPSDAIKFVEFLSSTEAMQIMYDHKVKLPALKDYLLLEIDGLSENETLLSMAEQLKTSIPMPYISNITYYWGPGETMLRNLWDNNSSVILDLVTTAEETYQNLAY
ncbi:MAG: extracellular solute-binding protein [Acholeplasmataceae bacterium]|nr:extracellular solute-binding protein [Acholeplasmataceae bacterium]